MDRVFKLYMKMYNSKNSFIQRMIHFYLRVVYTCDIMPKTIIGEGTKFAHNGLGVVINENVKIGKNCKIGAGVIIGGRSGKIIVPTIGDNVIIGANSCIIGPVCIGDGAKIGAGAVVVHDVPEKAVVVGNPAKIIKVLK